MSRNAVEAACRELLQTLVQAFHTAQDLFSLSSHNIGVKYPPTLFLCLVDCTIGLLNPMVLYSLEHCRDTRVK